jgi:hypothetical protein
MIRTMHDAVTERHAHDDAMEARAARRDAKARELAEHNAKEKALALDDPRIGLVSRNGRLVAYAFVAGKYVEGTVRSVLAVLHA